MPAEIAAATPAPNVLTTTFVTCVPDHDSGAPFAKNVLPDHEQRRMMLFVSDPTPMLMLLKPPAPRQLSISKLSWLVKLSNAPCVSSSSAKFAMSRNTSLPVRPVPKLM